MIHLFPTDIQSIIFSYLSRDEYMSFVIAYQSDIKRCLKGIHFDFDYLIAQMNPHYYEVSFIYSNYTNQPEGRLEIGKYSNLDDAILDVLDHFYWDNSYLWESTYDHYFYVLKHILDTDKISYDYVIRKYNIPCELIEYQQNGTDELINGDILDQTLNDMMSLCKDLLKRHCFEKLSREYTYKCDFPQLKLSRSGGQELFYGYDVQYEYEHYAIEECKLDNI